MSIDLGPVRNLVRDLNFEVHGVPAVITVPNGAPVSTRIIWISPETPQLPLGGGAVKASKRKVAAVKLADVPAVPRGTLIVAPGRLGEVVHTNWTVDGTDALKADHTRVSVLPA